MKNSNALTALFADDAAVDGHTLIYGNHQDKESPLLSVIDSVTPKLRAGEITAYGIGLDQEALERRGVAELFAALDSDGTTVLAKVKAIMEDRLKEHTPDFGNREPLCSVNSRPVVLFASDLYGILDNPVNREAFAYITAMGRSLGVYVVAATPEAAKNELRAPEITSCASLFGKRIVSDLAPSGLTSWAMPRASDQIHNCQGGGSTSVGSPPFAVPAQRWYFLAVAMPHASSSRKTTLNPRLPAGREWAAQRDDDSGALGCALRTASQHRSNRQENSRSGSVFEKRLTPARSQS